MDQKPSILIPNGYSKSSCGYCKSKEDTSAKVGFLSQCMQVSDYQALVDRGWRRSGEYYYKPDVRNSCCPQYTIRLDASSFRARKDQRKALNRWNRYVLGTEYARKAAILCPRSRQEKKRMRTQPDLLRTVHEAEYHNLPHPYDRKTKEKIEPARKFEVILEPDNFTEEKFRLWQNYQKHVHHESLSENTRQGFKRFLCSGIGQQDRQDGPTIRKLGSFHQCYRVDGRLIAMGVLDLLPHCVSSVYLIYHNDFQDWAFGKISAVREIMLARESGYAYHYMGFYVHSCQKMRYKADFRPSFLLDPISYGWDPLDEELLSRLSCRQFVSMRIENLLEIPSNSEDVEKWLANPAKKDLITQSFHVGNVQYADAVAYVKGTSHGIGLNTSASSPFEAGMPGILTLGELGSVLDLGRWRLMLRGRLIHLEDVVAWNPEDMMNSETLTGVTAELAASIGKELVEKTVLSFSYAGK